MRRNATEAQKKFILDNHLDYTVKEICEMFSLGQTYVRYFLKDNNIKCKKASYVRDESYVLKMDFNECFINGFK